MSDAIRKNCMICGRAFEINTLEDSPLLDDPFAGPPRESTSICPICEARIRKEAGDSQKEPKPM